MKQTRILMDMHVTVEVADKNVTAGDIDAVYDYFGYIDQKFSLFKEASEISQINNGKLSPGEYSGDMRKVLDLCVQTKKETNGYFDNYLEGKIDPTGVVKGWAIKKAAELLQKRGLKNFYVDAGGDVQVAGKNGAGKAWRTGIRNPFNKNQIVKIVALEDRGIATSGTSERGQHIFNPHKPGEAINDIVSLTVVGPDVLEADRFATPAFAMGRAGIKFIEKTPGLEGYMVDARGMATYTSGFGSYVI